MTQLSRRTKCRGCGKEIAFIKTKAGKSMPVDPEAVYFIRDCGCLFVMPDGSTERGRLADFEEKAAIGIPGGAEIGYISHFATCPAADQFRKKNKSERTRKE